MPRLRFLLALVMLLGMPTCAPAAELAQLGPAQASIRAIKKPTAPTSLSTSILSDSSLHITWAATAAGASTKVYRNGVEVCSVSSGTTQCDDTGLTRATTYTYTAKHAYGAVLSDPTGGVSGRPTVVATGGTESSPGDGYHYHYFTASATFTITAPGQLSYWGIGAGGSGGAGADSGAAEEGGGGGAAGCVFTATDTLEPANAYAVVVGGGNTTYRAETGTAGSNGAAGNSGGAGGDGGSNCAYSGGSGFAAGFGNNGGGGGGAGSAASGANGGLFGGGGGTGTAFPLVGTVGVGGNGGRVSGNGEDATYYGNGGNGNTGAGTTGGAGYQGIFIVRYPI